MPQEQQQSVSLPHGFPWEQPPAPVEAQGQPVSSFSLDGYAGVVEEVRADDWELQPKLEPVADWTLLVFGFAFVLVIATRLGFERHFRALFEVFFAPRFLRQAMREEAHLFHPGSIMLLLLFAVISGLFLYQLQVHRFLGFHLFEGSGFIVFLKIAGTVAVIYLVKIIVIQLLQWLLQGGTALSEYLFAVLMFNKMLGMLLLPLTIGIAYVAPGVIHTLLWVALAVVLLCWIYRIGRGFYTGLSTGVSFLYLFLYLCTLEILPLIVIFGLFSGRISVFS